MFFLKGKNPALSIDSPQNNAMITQGGKVFTFLLKGQYPWCSQPTSVHSELEHEVMTHTCTVFYPILSLIMME